MYIFFPVICLVGHVSVETVGFGSMMTCSYFMTSCRAILYSEFYFLNAVCVVLINVDKLYNFVIDHTSLTKGRRTICLVCHRSSSMDRTFASLVFIFVYRASYEIHLKESLSEFKTCIRDKTPIFNPDAHVRSNVSKNGRFRMVGRVSTIQQARGPVSSAYLFVSCKARLEIAL